VYYNKDRRRKKLRGKKREREADEREGLKLWRIVKDNKRKRHHIKYWEIVGKEVRIRERKRGRERDTERDIKRERERLV
jgi:hypothetical protein